MTEDFDWNEDESVIIREQAPTALYLNRHGSLVIRQDGTSLYSNDQTVILRPSDAVTLARAILHEIGELVAKDPVVERPLLTLKDPTAAERQRKCRAKKREMETATPAPMTNGHAQQLQLGDE